MDFFELWFNKLDNIEFGTWLLIFVLHVGLAWLFLRKKTGWLYVAFLRIMCEFIVAPFRFLKQCLEGCVSFGKGYGDTTQRTSLLSVVLTASGLCVSGVVLLIMVQVLGSMWHAGKPNKHAQEAVAQYEQRLEETKAHLNQVETLSQRTKNSRPDEAKMKAAIDAARKQHTAASAILKSAEQLLKVEQDACDKALAAAKNSDTLDPDYVDATLRFLRDEKDTSDAAVKMMNTSVQSYIASQPIPAKDGALMLALIAPHVARAKRSEAIAAVRENAESAQEALEKAEAAPRNFERRRADAEAELPRAQAAVEDAEADLDKIETFAGAQFGPAFGVLCVGLLVVLSLTWLLGLGLEILQRSIRWMDDVAAIRKRMDAELARPATTESKDTASNA
ncbi:MAG: hypothetical protein EXS14_09045 [Planctomycetes bacterium]|nr:hypothetical protein [Planctomycetota bacterium]